MALDCNDLAGHEPLCPSELTLRIVTDRCSVRTVDLAVSRCIERGYVRTTNKNARRPGPEGGFPLEFPHFEAEQPPQSSRKWSKRVAFGCKSTP